MKTKVKKAYIAAGGGVLVAIIGLVSMMINKSTANEVPNGEAKSIIGIENREINVNDDASINALEINAVISQTTIYYNMPDKNNSDDNIDSDSEKGTKPGLEFYTEIKARLADSDDKAWRSSVYAGVGDIVEFQMQYKNISDETHFHVAVRDILPKNLKYVDGSTKLYNTDYPEGISIDQDNLVTNGIFIGNYAAGANAFVRFRAEVVGDNVDEGVYLLYNWGQAQAGATDQVILQDDACVIVEYNKD